MSPARPPNITSLAPSDTISIEKMCSGSGASETPVIDSDEIWLKSGDFGDKRLRHVIMLKLVQILFELELLVNITIAKIRLVAH